MRHIPRIALATLLVSVISSCDNAPTTPGKTIGPLETVAATGFVHRDLGTLGGFSSYAQDINASGTVAGFSNTASGQIHAFRWTLGGGMVDLGTLPGDQESAAYAISASGDILGTSGSLRGRTPVIWPKAGGIHPVGVTPLPNDPYMFASDFNERGEVVGTGEGEKEIGWYWTRRSGTVDLTNQLPYVGEGFSASKINGSGLVVGSFGTSGVDLRAFLWSKAGGYRSLGVPNPGAEYTEVTGIGVSNSGIVTGGTITGASGYRAYMWTPSKGYVILAHFPSPVSETFPFDYAESVNGRGVVVGASYSRQHDAIQAALWTSPNAIVNLNGDEPNSSVAMAINDRGIVAGWTSLNDVTGISHATVWSPGAARGSTQTASAPPPAGQPPLLHVLRATPGSCLSETASLRTRLGLARCVLERTARK
jgi:probable HAF family extracellular repeat protein